MTVFIFLMAIVVANLSVAYFGPVSTPFNAFFLIGLDLTLRDKLHESWHGRNLPLKMAGLVCAGAVITYALNRNSGMIGVASVVAFSAALLVDWLIYQGMWGKPRWKKMFGSNVGSSLVDSVLFPTIAFGVIMPEIIILQFLAKVFGGGLWIWVLTRRWRCANGM